MIRLQLNLHFVIRRTAAQRDIRHRLAEVVAKRRELGRPQARPERVGGDGSARIRGNRSKCGSE